MAAPKKVWKVMISSKGSFGIQQSPIGLATDAAAASNKALSLAKFGLDPKDARNLYVSAVEHIGDCEF